MSEQQVPHVPHVIDELAAFLSGNLGEQAGARIRDHLESCSTCRREFDSMKALWESLARVPDEKPGESVRARFYDMLDTYSERGSRGEVRPDAAWDGWIGRLFPKRPALQLAFAVVAVLAGMFAGYRLKGESAGGTEFTQLHEEVRGLSRLLTISLLQQESASERLRGVSWSYRTPEPDAEITGALVQTLKYDPNVNVRLAALDALSRNIDQSDIRQDLVRSLPRQSSPLVQAAIIDLMIELHEKSSLNIFRQMAQDTALNRSVRKKIEQGIQQLI